MTDSSFLVVPERRSAVMGTPHGRVAVVVGGGVAGLSAARALSETGWSVVVLEARDRLGGRVWTTRALGHPVDLGASWVHGTSDANPVARLARELGALQYKTSGEDSPLYDHDLVSYALFDESGDAIAPSVVSGVERLFERVLARARELGAALSPESDTSLAHLVARALREERELAPRTVQEQCVLSWFLCRVEGWFATDLHLLSARNWDSEELLPGGHSLLPTGYEPVVSHLARGLDVRLSTPVASIRTHEGGVEVRTRSGDVLGADAVVCAVPLGVLQADAIRFDPPLPPWKQGAVRKAGVGVENKIALRFDRAFWPDVDFIGHVAPTPAACSYFLNLHRSTGQPILVYMPAGTLAQNLELLPDAEVVSHVVGVLRRLLPHAEVPAPAAHLVSRWQADEFARGAYVFDAVGCSDDFYDELARPVGARLHFAGEHTCGEHPGTVHGALISGRRAASDVAASVAAAAPRPTQPSGAAPALVPLAAKL